MASVKTQMRKRTAFLLVLLFLCFIAVIAQLAVLQFVKGSDLQTQAEDLRTKSVSVAAKRGTIYDRTGKTLAVSLSADSIYASPQEVKSSDTVRSSALFLSSVLDLDYLSLRDKLNSDKYFVWIQRKADFEQAQKYRHDFAQGGA